MTLLRNVVVLFSLASGVVSTCYWPTGNATYDRDAYEHQPCSNDTTSPLNTICCALNRTNPSGGDKTNGRTDDECLPNGICRNRVLDHGTMEISYWRETCTSKDWKTGLCLDVCADDWTSGNGTTGAVMTPCDGTAGSLYWCCGVDTSCCTGDTSKRKTIAFEFRGAIPNTSSASSNPFTTATSTSTATSSPSSGGGGGLSTGAKAGIGIGAAIGGIFLLSLGFFIARRTSKNKAQPSQQGPGAMAGYAPPGGYEGPPPPVPEKVAYPHELSPQSRSELDYSPAATPMGKPAPAPSPSYEMPTEGHMVGTPQYETPQPQYASPQTQYENPQPVYDNSQTQYTSGYENPQSQYTSPQSQYQNPQPHYESPEAQYASPQATYNGSQQHYPNPQTHYPAPQ